MGMSVDTGRHRRTGLMSGNIVTSHSQQGC